MNCVWALAAGRMALSGRPPLRGQRCSTMFCPWLDSQVVVVSLILGNWCSLRRVTPCRVGSVAQDAAELALKESPASHKPQSLQCLERMGRRCGAWSEPASQYHPHGHGFDPGGLADTAEMRSLTQLLRAACSHRRTDPAHVGNDPRVMRIFSRDELRPEDRFLIWSRCDQHQALDWLAARAAEHRIEVSLRRQRNAGRVYGEPSPLRGTFIVNLILNAPECRRGEIGKTV